RAATRDAAAPVGLPRLELLGRQADIGRHLLAALEALGLVQVGDDGLGRAWADAGSGLQELHALVLLRERVEALFGLVEQFAELVILSRGEVQQAAPQFVGCAAVEGFGL